MSVPRAPRSTNGISSLCRRVHERGLPQVDQLAAAHQPPREAHYAAQLAFRPHEGSVN